MNLLQNEVATGRNLISELPDIPAKLLIDNIEQIPLLLDARVQVVLGG